MNKQLALALQMNNEATLADFCWGENILLKQQIAMQLRGQGERFIFLWGNTGCGKSHVLQGICQALPNDQSAIYLPLNTLKEWGAQVIEDIDDQTLIAVDDIDAIANDVSWEEALFHLYNRVRDNEKTHLIITGKTAPGHLFIQLPDLQSRLSWGLVLQLHELNDEDKISTIKYHAHKRGFELSDPVARFLLSRCARNMHDLYQLLEKLDEASLIAQRRITIPFVKNILGI